MEKSNVRKQIEERIAQSGVKPTARWFFDAQNLGLWLLGILAILVGSVAVSTVAHIIVANVTDVYYGAIDNRAMFALSTLPYIWIIAVIIFLFVAHREVRATFHGYKYATLHIAGGLLVSTLIGGGALYAAGVGSATDELFAHRVALYKSVGNRQHIVWVNPDGGRLAGVVAFVQDETRFVLVDFNGNLWDVDATNARSPISFTLQPEEKIKMQGEVQREHVFLAKVILPFVSGPPTPPVLRYRYDIQQKRIDEFVEQSRERNFSPARTR